jgi:hypothetical protein
MITLRVTPPWGGCPIGVPVNVRLHRKGDETTTAGHAAAMMAELAEWLPDREFHLCADGPWGPDNHKITDALLDTLAYAA